MSEQELAVVSVKLVEEPPLYSRKVIRAPSDIIEVMSEELQKYDRELFCILNLRSKGQVINMNVVSMGSLNAAIAHPREVFKSAILSNAASILLIHNHPSGNCEPSEEDIAVTKRMIECGDLLGIEVLDHIVIGEQEHYSLRENTFLFPREKQSVLVAEREPYRQSGR